MSKKITYEKHPREYSVVGSTALFSYLQQKEFFNFYGGILSEVLSVVKDGTYFHYQIEGERDKIAKKFIKRIDDEEIDLDKAYYDFDRQVARHEFFLKKTEKDFSKETVLELFANYKILANVSLAAIDPINVIDELEKNKAAKFKKWAQKARKREENVYKDGEMKFMPKYLNWLSKKFLPNYKAEHLRYLMYKELEDYIKFAKQLPTVEELENRKKLMYVAQYPGNKIIYYSGQEAQRYIDEKGLLPNQVEYKNIKKIIGQTAYKGKVIGRVRLIRKREDMAKFKTGEILVASMTEPSYLPIMKKAIAFITDEGGKLCHAAIMARELKKPCVIGTKIATQVLKDGDRIEVDASSGVIKKIN